MRLHMSKSTGNSVFGCVIRTLEDLPRPLLVTGERTIRAWEILLSTIGPITFPEPESHWHYKFRMFRQWLKRLPHRIRWRIFPYHIIHKDDYEKVFEYE